MEFTPKQIITELDRYIIGQDKAKRAVAIALRNRYRRSRLTPELRQEITPKNIIMQGPTGVGKTEIARRLAKLVKAPFVKVEATKFTEVGYVGRDVESMIRDLVEVSVRLVKEEKYREVEAKAAAAVEKILMPVLIGIKGKEMPEGTQAKEIQEAAVSAYRAGELDDRIVEIEVVESPKSQQIMPGSGVEINIGEMLGGILPKRKRKRKLTVKKARELLMNAESEKLIDTDNVNAEAIERAENEGIIFIDERQDNFPRHDGRTRRFARGRSSRHSADSRRLQRQYEIRNDKDGLYPLYRRGRLSYLQDLRSHSRASGQIPHLRQARKFGQRGFRAHTHADGQRHIEAIHRTFARG